MSFEDKVKDVLIKYSNLKYTDKALYHSYEYFYPSELKYLTEKPENELNILEIGTDKGGSMMCWMEIFPNANFFGIDHDLSKLFDNIKENPKIKFYESSQTNEALINVFDNIKFDLVIEDASHKDFEQIKTFELFKNRITKNGKYIIEDIYPENNYPDEFIKNFNVVDLTHIKNRGDDKLFIYQNK